MYMYTDMCIFDGEASAVKRAPPVRIDPDELPAREKFRLMQAGSVSRSWGGGRGGGGLGFHFCVRCRFIPNGAKEKEPRNIDIPPRIPCPVWCVENVVCILWLCRL